MPPRSNVAKLPDNIRDELQRRLHESGYGDYQEHADWLKEQGYEVSKSALHVYGARFEKKMEAWSFVNGMIQKATEDSGGDVNALGDVLLTMLQGELLEQVMALKVEPETVDLQSLVQMVVMLNKEKREQENFKEDFRKRVAARFAELEKETQDNGLAGRTLDPTTLKRVREEIYGML